MIGPILFSLLFIAVGIGIIVYARKMSLKAKASLSWPYVEGQIAHSAVASHINRSKSSSRISYKADILYRYRVNSIDYSSSAIAVCDTRSGYANAHAVVVRYPHDAKVKVYYNPNNPSDSLLEPGNAAGVTLLFVVGGVFSAAGLCFILTSFLKS